MFYSYVEQKAMIQQLGFVDNESVKERAKELLKRSHAERGKITKI